jgi:leader peptidase (prepilin peptidase)/N-methyltransferase
LSWVYPLLEVGAMGVVLWAMTEMRGEVLWVSAVLGWVLLALALMDWRKLMLADVLTLPLIPAGLGVAWWLDPAGVHWHAVGAAAGFALMVGVGWTYQALRGREGLGLGDAKLMAGAGAWVGLEGLGTVLLYGAFLSLVLVAALRVGGQEINRETAVPFGVGLAAGFWLTWLYGPLLLGG